MKKHLLYALVFVIGVLIPFLLPKCGGEAKISENNRYKDSVNAEILKEKAKKDSVHKEVVKEDSVRTVVIYKYRTDKRLKLPCDTLLKIIQADCDTIIVHDSIEIKKMAVEQMISNLIIENQGSIMKVDSSHISNLLQDSVKSHSKIRKLKKQRNGFAGLSAVLAVFGIVK